MSDEKSGISCTMGCWALAAGAGFLTFVLLLVLGGQGWIGSIFLGAVLCVVLGLLFSWIFCRDLPAPGEVTPGEDRGLRAVPPTEEETPPATTPTAAAASPAAAVVAPAAESSKPAPAAKSPEQAASPAKVAAPAASEGKETKPQMMDAPREGGADNLKEIKGIGPKLEQLCNSLGVYHFDQIAGWSAEEIAWMDANLEGFRGRVSRDDWVGQAKVLASGGDTDFSSRVDKGEVY